MIYRVCWAFGLLLWYAPQFALAQEPPATVAALVGGGVSLSDESALIPRAFVSVDAPAFLGENGRALGRLRVDLVLSGLPGGAVDLADPITWKSAELYGEFQRRVGAWDGGETLIVGRSGFITRILPTDQTPRQRFARLYAAGVRVQRRDPAQGPVSRSIALMWGRSEIASPEFGRGQLYVEGQIKLTSLKGVTIILQGDAHLTLGHSGLPGERDVMRLGVLAGWGG